MHCGVGAIGGRSIVETSGGYVEQDKYPPLTAGGDRAEFDAWRALVEQTHPKLPIDNRLCAALRTVCAVRS